MRSMMMAGVVVALLGASLSAGEPVEISDAKDKEILAGFLRHAEKVPGEFTPEACKKEAAESAEGYTWVVLPQVSMLVTAYRLTGDAKYADLFVQTFDNMRSALTKGPDGYLGWYGKAISTFQDPKNPDKKVDVIITSYRAIEVVSEFLEAVAADEALSRKYEAKRGEYLDLLENHLAKKWVARGNYVDLGKQGAIFRTHFGLKDVKANLTQPHNKHSIIIQALLGLHRVTGKDEYARTAVKLGTRYKHCLKLKDGHYEWNYWDPAGAWDVNPAKPADWKHWTGVEHKGGYYSTSLTQAVVLYQHGLVFDRQDMDRFLKTQLQMCWNGSMDDPKWARVDGTTSDRYMQGSYMCAALAPFSEKLYTFIYTGPRQEDRFKNAGHSWQGGPVANGWLSGKCLDVPAARGGKQPHAEIGKKFFSKPENQALAKELDFSVTGDGYVTPESPKDMKPMPPEPAKK